jgi:hypothetical protein
VLLVALSGCTDGTNGVPDGAESTGESVVEPTGGPTPGPTSAVFDPDAAVLNVAISDPSTLDPMRIGDPGSVLVARQLYEGLTRSKKGYDRRRRKTGRFPTEAERSRSGYGPA